MKNAFTLAEVLIAKRKRGNMSLLNFSRMRELKEPSNRLLRRYAFTLAEVLITLGIIGIVAAMTIPTLISNSQKQQEVIQLKKFNSLFSSGIRTYMANNSCSDLTCTGIFNGWGAGAWETQIKDAIYSSFKPIKSCPPGNTSCGKQVKRLGIDGTFDGLFSSSAEYVFQLVDGTLFSIKDGDSSNCKYFSSTTTTSKLKNSCAIIYVDVNGDNKPNTYGRDVFIYYLGSDGFLYPQYGVDHAKAQGNNENYLSTGLFWQSNSGYCGAPNSATMPNSATGYGCAAKILDENWEMNY